MKTPSSARCADHGDRPVRRSWRPPGAPVKQRSAGATVAFRSAARCAELAPSSVGDRMSGRTIAAIGAWAALAAAGCQVQETSAPCERTCLLEIAEDYLAALAARDPS